MTTDPRQPLDDLILDHIEQANLSETATNLILAALLGQDELNRTLGGAIPPRRQPTPVDQPGPQAVGTYLTGIEVTGFRGIGPTATLNLKPGPGLTIVTGRNGSGKSSFAEAVEFTLTGDNKRWSGRGPTWQDGWRNLHTTEDPRIRVRFGIEGQPGGATIECHWAAGAGLADGTTFLQFAGKPRQSVHDLGWHQPLELYRPFLSYAELDTLLGGRPSEMYDSLHRILGLGRLVEIETMLKAARRATDEQRKQAAAGLPELRALLAAQPDPRARQAEDALAGQAADLDRLALIATVDEPADAANVVPLRQLDVLRLADRATIVGDVDRLRAAVREIDRLSGTPVRAAQAVAGLLRDALRHHQDHPEQPCPVCGGRTLDQDWARRAEHELHRLTELTEQIDAAQRTVRETRQALRDRLPTLPAALTLNLDAEQVPTGDARIAWQQWDELVGTADPVKIAEVAPAVFDELVATVEPVQRAARKALERRQQDWRPVAERIRTWVDAARTSRQAAQMHTGLRAAINELQKLTDQERNDRFAPVAERATTIWNTLRQQSSVDLGEIRLAGTGPTRRVKLDVEVDGKPGAALGVLSQGELHSLGLALFLPRATMPDSPFRFLVIDDPVQSMDPAKVYGLAQVLAEAAKDRQVIVFTHDDRLPAAVRHLQLDARILTVSRLAHSEVRVTSGRDGDPAQRYLNDARAVSQDDTMAEEVRVPVVCSLVRDALEYTCHELVRAQGFQAGTTPDDIEATIAAAHGLRATLALALLGDARRVGELPDRLPRLHPAAKRVVAAANSGAHGNDAGTLADLVDDARRVLERLARA